ncbi:MAG TPA: undecaprenyl-phosphate glucose phosphotransferase [Rhodothermales bacterium]|nr:undecaprenyl-phosphate glucose phosphotransferase [Rhodothermales bacterium]
MLKEQSRLYQRLLFFADLALVALGWALAYYIRFDLLTPPEWVPPVRYLQLLPWVLFLSASVFYASGLYAASRAQRLPLLVFAVARAVAFGLLLVTASLAFYRTFSFSRLHMILFGVITPVFMIVLRVALYATLRRARQRGRNVRRVLIVGAGKAGRRLARSFREYPWIDFEVVGFLDDHKPLSAEILGRTEEVTMLIDQFETQGRPVDYVYVALPLRAADKIERIVDELSVRLAHVYLVPDLFQFDILNSRITDVNGLPVIHIIDEAPLETRRLVKRLLDVAFASAFLVATSPLMLLIAAGIKLSSRGPVFYRQERMSLNGHRFQMLKFRSMPVDAEETTGPVWATPAQDRATPLGSFLRRTSLDELPQFVNVLQGDMSVVGPRPERPVFVEEFRSRVPRYMLRHKVRAGITGWAQVNGWRGNTSIDKRIECDLYYIQNWSLGLDFKIMWLTLWKGFVHEHAY